MPILFVSPAQEEMSRKPLDVARIGEAAMENRFTNVWKVMNTFIYRNTTAQLLLKINA